MDKLKVSTRLFLLIGLLAFGIAGVGSLGLFAAWHSNDAMKSVYEDRTVPAVQLGEIRAGMLETRLAVELAVLAGTAEAAKEGQRSVEAQLAAIDKTWKLYLATELTPEEKQLAERWRAARDSFVAQAVTPALAALAAGDTEGARRVERDRLAPMAAATTKGMESLMQLQVDEARKSYDDAADVYRLTQRAGLAALVLGVAAAVVFGTLLARSIAHQLGAEPAEAAAVARRVAAGDLSAPVPLEAGDATSLMAQLKSMQDNLAAVVQGVRSNADGVAHASAEIAAGNGDLSARTEEQASALEETAASMEQLGSAVQQNADNARQAHQLAQGAQAVAERGGAVVGQVVQTMHTINESSRRIADIIGTIDGIAFQTNILALNAAVEAARAGDQGRGFAVVASEVRALAQRSAEAAREIKSLITASVEGVDAGRVLVDQAGATMTEIVTSVRRVADIMGEITAATTEQSAGVAQVGEAVSQLDQTTQQNAALVEQSAAAAESLKHQAAQLVQAVAVFKLGGAAAAPAGAQKPERPAPAPKPAPAPRQAVAATAADAQWQAF